MDEANTLAGTLAGGTLAWKGGLVAAWFVLLFAAERFKPAADPAPFAARGAGKPARLVANAVLWVINSGVSLGVVIPITVVAAAMSMEIAPWRPDWWRGGWGMACDVLVLDLLIYWWHRFNHEWPFLWRFHEVHHLDQWLDTTSAVRFHFGKVLLSALARAEVILLIGFPLASVLAFEALVLIAAIFHHSNLKLPRALEAVMARLVITPSIHWVHHHAVKVDTDSNYGTIFSFWDRVFVTRNPAPRRADMVIGVENASEEPLTGLLVHPFRRRV